MSRVLLLATIAALAVGLVVVAAGSAGDSPDVRTERSDADAGADRTAPRTPTDGPFALAATRPESPNQQDVVAPRDRPRGGAIAARMRTAERDHMYRAYFLDDLARRLEVTNIEIRQAVRATLSSFRAGDESIDPRTANGEELAMLKRRLVARLAAELDRSPRKVEEAVRAEMIDTLRWAVDGGTITKAARARAVDCFDDPAACDVDALRASLPFGPRGR